MSSDRTVTSSPRQHRPWAAILLTILALALLCCLSFSLLGNVGLGLWAAVTQWQLARAQQRLEVLEARVQQLQDVLRENGLELPLSPADQQLMDTVEAQVAALRGLQPLQPVERTLMSREELYQEYRRMFEEDWSPAEARDYTLTLLAFDLLDDEIDAYDLLLRLYTEQVAGYYDPEREQMVVISDSREMGALQRLVYAHEFNHALQDQHFDLEALGIRPDADAEFDSEYLTAIRALIEGDSSLLERQFLGAYYTPQELAELTLEASAVDSTVLDATPPVVRAQMMFPYDYGLPFVEALYAEGGWAAVDAAYASPPRSTEQILHPQRYRSGDVPQLISLPPLTDTLGVGWQQVDSDILGEFFLRLYLARWIDEDEAAQAAEGWDGDRYAVHYRQADAAFVVAVHTVWDTPADAEEFVDASVNYGTARFGGAGELADGHLCWTGAGETLCLAWGPADVTFVLGPDRPTVDAVMGVVALP
jgi:hypothetical protein